MRIDRHRIDKAWLDSMGTRYRETVEELPSYVEAATRDAKNVSLLLGRAYAALGYGLVVEPESAELPSLLELAANCHTAIFAALFGQTQFETGAGKFGTLKISGAPDKSTVHIGRWINAFYFNVISGNMDSIQRLCEIPPKRLQESTTTAPNYKFLYMEALELYAHGVSDGLVKLLLSAVHETDPKVHGLPSTDWTLYMDVPQLEVLIYLATKDPKFGGALEKAAQLHKDYWSNKADRRRSYEGYFSVELTALAALGRSRGLAFDVESPYLPMRLVR